MAVSTFLCLGCGADIKNSKGNRLLSTKLTQHVIPVWKRLIEEEINRRGTETETATESLNVETLKSSGYCILRKLQRTCMLTRNYQTLFHYRYDHGA